MLRPATLDDAEAIATVHVRTWQKAYAGIFPADFLAGLSLRARTDFWREELTSKRSLVLVWVEEGEVVAWASGGKSRDADAKGGDAEIYAIYVLPEFWSRGIGQRLMSGLEAALSPASGLTLWVLRDNPRALAFYNKLGYGADGAEKMVQLGGKTLAEIRLGRIKDQQYQRHFIRSP